MKIPHDTTIAMDDPAAVVASGATAVPSIAAAAPGTAAVLPTQQRLLAPLPSLQHQRLPAPLLSLLQFLFRLAVAAVTAAAEMEVVGAAMVGVLD